MITRLEQPAGERLPSAFDTVGGGPATRRHTQLSAEWDPRAVGGFAVEWQLFEPPAGTVEEKPLPTSRAERPCRARTEA